MDGRVFLAINRKEDLTYIRDRLSKEGFSVSCAETWKDLLSGIGIDYISVKLLEEMGLSEKEVVSWG